MSISCACSSLSGSSWRSTWIEPDIDASGLRISCAMPAAISPTAASRCCSRALRSRRLMSVTSWNVKRKPVRPFGKRERRDRDADVDRAPVAAPELADRPLALRVSASVARRAREVRRQLQHVADVVPDGLRRRQPGDRRGGAVERQDAPVASAVTRPLSRLSMTCSLNARRSAICVRGVLEPRVGRTQPFGQRARQERHGEEAEQVDRHRVLREPQRRQRHAAARLPRRRKVRRHVHVLRGDDGQVEHARSAPPPAARRGGSGSCWPR